MIETHEPEQISDPFITITRDDKTVGLTVCHRRPDRSFTIGGKPILCWRCMGTYTSFIGLFLYQIVGVIIGFGSLLGPIRELWVMVTGNNMWLEIGWIIGLHVPMILDGTIQAKFSYESGTIRRMITGILAGIGQAAIFLLLGSIFMTVF